jgi:hypothetical protein
MYKLFKIDEAGDVHYDKAEYKLIPEFYEIMNRLVKGKGDYDGRKKLYNKRELVYIFYMADWTSSNIFAFLPDKERHEKAVIASRLEEDFEPDEAVIAAIDKYKEIQREYVPTARILFALKRNLMQTSRYLENLEAQNEYYYGELATLKEKMIHADEEDKLTYASQISSYNKMIADNSQWSMSATKKIQNSLKELKDMEAMVREEEAEKKIKKGGNQVNHREDPDYLKHKIWNQN